MSTLPPYRYAVRFMAQQTNLSDLDYQELRRTAWRKELAENYWGSAHHAPRYLARIESNIAAMTAQQESTDGK